MDGIKQNTRTPTIVASPGYAMYSLKSLEVTVIFRSKREILVQGASKSPCPGEPMLALAP